MRLRTRLGQLCISPRPGFLRPLLVELAAKSRRDAKADRKESNAAVVVVRLGLAKAKQETKLL